MRNISILFTLFLFFVLPALVAGQENTQTLLWRISGNGLKKPSYVFGTIHLKDKRLFHFADSVYAAIEKTEGLALELDLNAAAAYHINEAIESKLNDDEGLDQLLSEEEKRSYGPALARKFRKRLDRITRRDILQEKNRWVNEYFSKGAMPTFVDAYLYDIAKRQGKWLGGIEDVEDQLKMVDRFDVKMTVASDEKISFEKIISMYVKQDIKGFETMVNGLDPSVRDQVMIKRNVKMARRMDSLAAFRSMFFAIGAGHLAGDSGVISMLRARGFTMEPVHGSKKTIATDYVFKEVPIEWVEVTDKDERYTLSMPGNPASINYMGLFEMKFLLEMSNLSGYYSLATATSNSQPVDSLFLGIARRTFKKTKIGKPRRLELNGMTGAEYTEAMDGYSMRLHLYQKENIIYILAMYAAKESYLNTPDAQRFFGSLRATPGRKQLQDSYEFIDSVAGISFISPTPLSTNDALNKRVESVEGWNASVMNGMDVKTGSYIMLSIKSAGGGYNLVSDSAILAEAYQLTAEKIVPDTTWTNIQGRRALMIEGLSPEKIYMQILSFVRGNTHISLMLFSIDSLKKDTRLQQVFTSLKLLPYQESIWSRQSDSTETFGSIAPGSFTKVAPDYPFNSQSTQYYSYDTMTATTYYVGVDTLNPFVWASSDTAMLAKDLKEYIGDSDTVTYLKWTSNAGARGREVLLVRGDFGKNYRTRIISTGNLKYTLSAIGDNETIQSANTERFFSDFTAKPGASFQFTGTKADDLISALQGADSARRMEAYHAIEAIYFEEKDLPFLQAAFLKTYPGLYGDTAGTQINTEFADVLVKRGDSATISFVESQYPILAKAGSRLQSPALNILAQIKTKESYSTLTKLILADRSGKDVFAGLSYILLDSIPLALPVYAALSPYTADTNIGRLVVNMATSFLDDSLIALADLRLMSTSLVKLAQALHPGLRSSEDWDYSVFNLINLLDTLQTEEANNALKLFLDSRNLYLRKHAAITLARKGKNLEQAIWEGIAADAGARKSLHTQLEEMDKGGLFPQRYLQQNKWAESELYEYLSEYEDAEPDSVLFIGERIAQVNGSKFKFYLYRVWMEPGKDASSYLGVAGGYRTTGKSLEVAKYLTGLNQTSDFSTSSSIDDLFNEFLKEQESGADPHMD